MTAELKVIVGCVCSGKSERLQELLRRQMIAGKRVVLCVPEMDDRFGEQKTRTHAGRQDDSLVVRVAPKGGGDSRSDSGFLFGLRDEFEVIGVEEGQFFDDHLPDVVSSMAGMNRQVLVAGLNRDWMGQEFLHMARAMARADEVISCFAVCKSCGSQRAVMSFRLGSDPGSDRLVVGGTESYEALCRSCYLKKI